MKKILMAICAIAALTFTGCKDETTDNPVQQEPAGDGIYNPGAKIATVATDSEVQTWVWNGTKLDRIESADPEGNANGVQQFGYTGDRIASIAQTLAGVETETRITYAGNYISAIGIYTDGTQSLNATVTHNAAHKISRMDLDIDASYLNQLLGTLMQGGFNFMPAKGESKLSLTSATVYATMEWLGDNVSRMIVNADINAGITMDDISQFVDLTEYLGEMASLVSLIQGEQPLTLSLRDTMDFTYDDQHNPLQGFIGLLDPSVLSANNSILTNNHGIADVNLTLNIPIVGAYPIERTVPITRVMDYFYTYNAAGFPLTVHDDEGNYTTYTYQE